MIVRLNNSAVARHLGAADVREHHSISDAVGVLVVGALGLLIRALLIGICGLLAFAFYALVQLL